MDAAALASKLMEVLSYFTKADAPSDAPSEPNVEPLVGDQDRTRGKGMKGKTLKKKVFPKSGNSDPHKKSGEFYNSVSSGMEDGMEDGRWNGRWNGDQIKELVEDTKQDRAIKEEPIKETPIKNKGGRDDELYDSDMESSQSSSIRGTENKHKRKMEDQAEDQEFDSTKALDVWEVSLDRLFLSSEGAHKCCENLNPCTKRSKGCLDDEALLDKSESPRRISSQHEGNLDETEALARRDDKEK
jgi:hypothetical protein